MDVGVKNFIGIVATIVISIVVLIFTGFACWNLVEENTFERQAQSEIYYIEHCRNDYGTIKMEETPRGKE